MAIIFVWYYGFNPIQPPLAKQEDIEPMQTSTQEANGFEKIEKETRSESPVDDFVLVPAGLQEDNSGILLIILYSSGNF